MLRLWDHIADVLTASPAALFVVLTVGPVILCIGWLILQAFQRV